MKVVVYVEGPGDQICLETLLRPLLIQKSEQGVHISFVPMTRGDRKTALLVTTPIKAANALLNDPAITVVILPDLYPPNKGFKHDTCEQLQEGVRTAFLRSASSKPGWDPRIESRFAVFCLIHDLEVLLLAAEEALLAVASPRHARWSRPVETQNNEDPPKRVVERLIPGYDSQVDGPRILSAASYREVAEQCPLGFGRFVRFIEGTAAYR